jgi:hypothetical protein
VARSNAREESRRNREGGREKRILWDGGPKDILRSVL